MEVEQREGWIWEYVDTGQPDTKSLAKKKTGVLLRDETYPCPFCKSTGLSHTGATCPICHGRETIKARPPVVVCACCKGKGTEQPRSGVTCPACRGKGFIRVKEPVEKCGTCGGRGRPIGSNLYCLTCKGAGVVQKKVTAAGVPKIVRRPLPSEKEVMEVLHEEGRAGRFKVAARMHVSTVYANYLCKSLVEKGLIERIDRHFFILTPAGETIFEKKDEKEEKREVERLKEEQEQLKAEPAPDKKYEEYMKNYGMWRIEK